MGNNTYYTKKPVLPNSLKVHPSVTRTLAPWSSKCLTSTGRRVDIGNQGARTIAPSGKLLNYKEIL